MLARVFQQQLLDPPADLLAGVLGQAGVVRQSDLQPDQDVEGHRCGAVLPCRSWAVGG
jgi:hypothetical protein